MITPYGPAMSSIGAGLWSFTTPMRNAVRGSARARCAARCRPMRAPAGAARRLRRFRITFRFPPRIGTQAAGGDVPPRLPRQFDLGSRPAAAALGGRPPGPPPRRPAAACRNPMGPGPGRRLQPRRHQAMAALLAAQSHGCRRRRRHRHRRGCLHAVRGPSPAPAALGRDLPAWRATRAARRRGCGRTRGTRPKRPSRTAMGGRMHSPAHGKAGGAAARLSGGRGGGVSGEDRSRGRLDHSLSQVKAMQWGGGWFPPRAPSPGFSASDERTAPSQRPNALIDRRGLHDLVE